MSAWSLRECRERHAQEAKMLEMGFERVGGIEEFADVMQLLELVDRMAAWMRKQGHDGLCAATRWDDVSCDCGLAALMREMDGRK